MAHPIELFDKLDKSKSSVKKLRKAQEEVVSKYANELQNAERIGIKLPTGSGKSLIAILILEAWRRSGKVVAIITANKGLADDIKRRCDELQIPSATIFGASGDSTYQIERTRNLQKYKRKQIIGIFNYHAFLYGTEYKQEIYLPDVLVIDDASDFETTRNDFFTVRLDRRDHPKVYASIIDKLKPNAFLYPNLAEFEGGKANQSKVELVYFTDVSNVLDVLREKMTELKQDQNFYFAYERNRALLHSFLVLITNDEIEFRPLLIPEESLKMGKIAQIIFMSATLPDEELLHKIFGIRKTRVHMIDEQSISKEAFDEIETMGKRLIFPLDQTDLGARVSEKCFEIMLQLLRTHKKILVLANSFFDTEAIKAHLEHHQIPVLICRNPGDSEIFAHTMNFGALLCANRYLGLDFPGDTCKVEVIVRLPAIWDSIDAFQQTVLRNDFYAEQRIGNRLTQSFGRCNRLETDQALYYVLDSRILARLTGDEGYLRYLPRNMYAELMTGYALSQGGNIIHALDYGEKSFMGKEDDNYRRILQEEKESWVSQQTKTFVSKYDIEIEAWEKSLSGNYENAGQLLDFVATNCAENSEAFPNQNLKMISAFNYYLSSMCYYNALLFHRNPANRQLCLNALKKAIENGGNSSWFNHLRAIYNTLIEKDDEKLSFDSERIELRQVKETISEKYSDFVNSNSSRNRNWKDAFIQLSNDISKGSHGQMVVALQRCLELMGFDAFLGSNSKGEPDLIAVTSPVSWKYQLAIEVKTKEKSEEESVESINQIMGDASLMEKKTAYKVFPVLITQKEAFSPKAIEMAKSRMRIISSHTLVGLMDHVMKLMDSWNSLSASGRPQFVDSILSHYELGHLFAPSDNPIITTEEVTKVISTSH